MITFEANWRRRRRRRRRHNCRDDGGVGARGVLDFE